MPKDIPVLVDIEQDKIITLVNSGPKLKDLPAASVQSVVTIIATTYGQGKLQVCIMRSRTR